MSKKQLLKRELNLHGLEIPLVGEEPDSPLSQEMMAPATIAVPAQDLSILLTSEKEVATAEPGTTAKPDLKNNTDHTDEPFKQYDGSSKPLEENKLKKQNSKIKSRRAKRRRGGYEREKWTTSLQPKFLEMLDVCSLREGFRDMNEYVEYILARHASKIGYNLDE
jgi:hypothetical protein